MNTFEPVADGDYGWVFEYAAKRWDEQFTTYQKLDDKAASIITWVGGGTGLFAIGVITSITEGKLVGWPALLTLVPISVALYAVYLAVKARYSQIMAYGLPTVQDMTEWVALPKPDHIARLAEWNLAIVYLQKKKRERAELVNESLRFAFRAVLALCAPLLIAVYTKWPISQSTPTITMTRE